MWSATQEHPDPVEHPDTSYFSQVHQPGLRPKMDMSEIQIPSPNAVVCEYISTYA